MRARSSGSPVRSAFGVEGLNGAEWIAQFKVGLFGVAFTSLSASDGEGTSWRLKLREGTYPFSYKEARPQGALRGVHGGLYRNECRP